MENHIWIEVIFGGHAVCMFWDVKPLNVKNYCKLWYFTAFFSYYIIYIFYLLSDLIIFLIIWSLSRCHGEVCCSAAPPRAEIKKACRGLGRQTMPLCGFVSLALLGMLGWFGCWFEQVKGWRNTDRLYLCGPLQKVSHIIFHYKLYLWPYCKT